MNILQCQTKAIQLINQYSTNGSLTSDSANADYLLRVPNLIDACQKELANYFPIVAESDYTLTAVSNPTDWNRVSIPAKLLSIRALKLSAYPYYTDVKYILENTELLIDPLLSGNLVLTYNKMPDDITSSTPTSTNLELREDVQAIIPYYVAGHIYQEDNQSIATLLLNEYETKKAQLRNYQFNSEVVIENVFEGFM